MFPGSCLSDFPLILFGTVSTEQRFCSTLLCPRAYKIPKANLIYFHVQRNTCGAMPLEVEVVVKLNNVRLTDCQQSWQMACEQRMYYIRILLSGRGTEGELTFMDSLSQGTELRVSAHKQKWDCRHN